MRQASSKMKPIITGDLRRSDPSPELRAPIPAPEKEGQPRIMPGLAFFCGFHQ
jgi:hypothetical protein